MFSHGLKGVQSPEDEDDVRCLYAGGKEYSVLLYCSSDLEICTDWQTAFRTTRQILRNDFFYFVFFGWSRTSVEVYTGNSARDRSPNNRSFHESYS